MIKFIFLQLGLFTAKTFILVFFSLLFIAGLFFILSKSKGKNKGRLVIKNLNEQYEKALMTLQEATLSKDEYKHFAKRQKHSEKEKLKNAPNKKLFVLNFDGDVKASALSQLRVEISAVLSIATPQDEVLLKLESGGGMVHAYGLAASQLQRLRNQNISLTVVIDKVAASGGYLMASVANKILAAPFAIIGSIGVIVQMPNFNRLLKDKKIDFEQLTAGDFKRTLTLFGENTDEGREKLREEIEQVHDIFKNHIHLHRPQLDIEKVATGEHWLGSQALTLNLIDEIQTSDEYIFTKIKDVGVYEIQFESKKSLASKLTSAVAKLQKSQLEKLMHH